MEIKVTEKGRAAGNISIALTLDTMQPGDVWVVGKDNPIANVRVYCSRYGIGSGRRFNVTSNPDGDVVITRKL